MRIANKRAALSAYRKQIHHACLCWWSLHFADFACSMRFYRARRCLLLAIEGANTKLRIRQVMELFVCRNPLVFPNWSDGFALFFVILLSGCRFHGGWVGHHFLLFQKKIRQSRFGIVTSLPTDAEGRVSSRLSGLLFDGASTFPSIVSSPCKSVIAPCKSRRVKTP